MYDRSRAAYNRIIGATREYGPVGRMYRDLAKALLSAPDSPRRDASLKKLADSCDSAMSMLEKVGQSRRNPPPEQRPPGETNG